MIGVRGIQNSIDMVYQHMLDEVKPKYPAMSLAALLGDTREPRSVPYVGERAGGCTALGLWEERVLKAIDEAGEQHSISGDWVLSDAPEANAFRKPRHPGGIDGGLASVAEGRDCNTVISTTTHAHGRRS